MKNYYYRSIDNHQRIHTGCIQVENVAELEKSLKSRNLFLIEYAIKSESIENRFSFNKKIKIEQQIQLLFEWLLLLESGITVVSSVESLIESSETLIRKHALQAVLISLEQGKPLHQALSNNEVFSPMVKEFIRIGENSGSLISSIKYAYSYLEEQKANQEIIKQAMLYPLFTVSVGLGAVIFLSYWMLPELASFLLSLDQELPTTTMILITIADWLQKDSSLLLPIFILLFLIIFVSVKTGLISHYQIGAFYWKLPIFGPIKQMIFISQFSRLLSITLNSGLTLPEAIKISTHISKNKFAEQQIDSIYKKIEQGFSFHHALNQSQLLPKVVVSLIYNAEKTGRIIPCLNYISEFYRQKANRRLQKIQKLIEPCLTLLIGSILAFFIVATLGPLYELGSQLGQ